MEKKSPFLPKPYIHFILLWILLCIFSFAKKDPNLTIYNFYPVINVINFIFNGYHQFRLLFTLFFIFIILGLMISYFRIIFNQNLHKKVYLVRSALILIAIGIFAYPMFSHDLFSYLFYPKEIFVYSKSPYSFVPLDFPNDPWLRFMHNVQLPSPYGYTWIFLSSLFTFFTIHSFTLSFVSIKLLISLFYLLSAYLVYLLALRIKKDKAIEIAIIFIFNPLLLAETIINGHNDIVMIAFSLLALYLLEYLDRSKLTKILFSSIAFIASILVKYATIVLIPIYIFCKKFKLDFFAYAGLTLLLAMIGRYDQTHAWYLLWSFSFLVLTKYIWLKYFSIVLTLLALIRYIPFIYLKHWYPAEYPSILFFSLLVPIFYYVKSKRIEHVK